MRAYLGNIVVTPQLSWLKVSKNISFPVKSEFIIVTPFDGLNYFWLVFLRSKTFLSNLPLGSGGTRPRLQIESLLKTPIDVPSLKKRKHIHNKLMSIAEDEWKIIMKNLKTKQTFDLIDHFEYENFS
jgi:restriction endonuclease S subunit